MKPFQDNKVEPEIIGYQKLSQASDETKRQVACAKQKAAGIKQKQQELAIPSYFVITMAIFILALLLRISFIETVMVKIPEDSLAFKNLVQAILHAQGQASPMAGSYPWLLSGIRQISQDIESFQQNVLLMQSLLGAASAVLVFRISLHLVPNLLSCLSALAFSVSPWMLVANSSYLSHSWLTFLILLSCWSLLSSYRRSNLRLAGLSGVTFSLAVLIQPALLLLPFFLSLLLFKKDKKLITTFSAAFLVPTLIISLPHLSPQYVEQAFAAGSSSQLNQQASFSGIASIPEKKLTPQMGDIPWYFIEKPLLLWSGNPDTNESGPYLYSTRYSILDSFVALDAIKKSIQSLHPILVVLAVATLFLLNFNSSHHLQVVAIYICASSAVYFTGSHMLFVASPQAGWSVHGLAYILGFAFFYFAYRVISRPT